MRAASWGRCVLPRGLTGAGFLGAGDGGGQSSEQTQTRGGRVPSVVNRPRGITSCEKRTTPGGGGHPRSRVHVASHLRKCWYLGAGGRAGVSRVLSPMPALPAASPAPPVVPQASAAAVTDPRAGGAGLGSRLSWLWSLRPSCCWGGHVCPGDQQLQARKHPPPPRSRCAPHGQPSLPRAGPRGTGAPHPHLLGLGEALGWDWHSGSTGLWQQKLGPLRPACA